MSKHTIQETESINSKTGAREKIYVVGIEGEKTDANSFWEFQTREEADAKVRGLESKNSNEKLTLRDQFAMASLSGLIELYGNHFDSIAESAYDIADEMLRARSEKNETAYGWLQNLDKLSTGWKSSDTPMELCKEIRGSEED